MTRFAFVLFYFIVFGPSSVAAESAYQEHHFQSAGADIHLVWYSSFTDAQQAKLTTWVKSGLTLVRHLNGALPRKKMRFHLQQQDSKGKSPVPYAQVLRDGMPGVHFWVDANRSDYDLKRDWTFTHELVHLFIDYPGDKDLWISEGLATYYQNILLVRGGLLTERDFWRRFIEGLRRGRHDSNYDGNPLEAVSEHMRGIGSYMRVYWSGALFFLQGSIALLERDQPHLDELLRTFIDCCQKKQALMRGQDLLKTFDKLAKGNWFQQQYEVYRYIDRMPNFDATLRSLGVELRGQYLYLDPSNSIRRKIVYGYD